MLREYASIHLCRTICAAETSKQILNDKKAETCEK